MRYYCACICVHGVAQCSAKRRISVLSEIWKERLHTDLTGPAEITCVWKLKGFLNPGDEGESAVSSSAFIVGSDREDEDAVVEEGISRFAAAEF
jgi:hypothetical protein